MASISTKRVDAGQTSLIGGFVFLKVVCVLKPVGQLTN